MAGQYTTGQDAQGNWYIYNQGVIPFKGGMVYYGGDTGQFDALKSQLNSAGGQEIWEGSQVPTSTAPSGGGSSGGSGTTYGPLNQAAVDNTQRTINEIPGLLAAALATEGTRYANAVGEFNQQEGTQRKQYDESTVTNQKNYDSHFMDSIRAGIKGLSGLFNILRGTGASGGTADDQVRDVVGGITASDIREGADTQQENQTQLDTSLSAFLTDLGRKRKQAEDTRVNNERAVRRDSNTQLQDLYGRMAGYYGDAGRTAEANSWMTRAGELTPSIAADSRTQLSAYDTSPVEVKAPELTAFAGPSQPDSISVPDSGQVGSGIFAITNKRRDRQPALAGA